MTVIGVDARPEFDSRGDECVVVCHVRHSVKDSRHFIQFASDLGVGARISIAESSLLVTLFTLLHFRCCMLPNSDFKYSSRSSNSAFVDSSRPVSYPNSGAAGLARGAAK